MKKLTFAVALLATLTLSSCDKLGDILSAIVEIVVVNNEGTPLNGVYDPGEAGDSELYVYDLRTPGLFNLVWADKCTDGCKAQEIWDVPVGEFYASYPPIDYPLFGYTSPENKTVGVMCFGDLTTWLYKTKDNGDLTIWDDPQGDDNRYPDIEESKSFIEEVFKNGNFKGEDGLTLKGLKDVPAHHKLYEKNMGAFGYYLFNDELLSDFPIPFMSGSYAIGSYELHFGPDGHRVYVYIGMSDNLLGKNVKLNSLTKDYPDSHLTITVFNDSKDVPVKTFEYKDGEFLQYGSADSGLTADSFMRDAYSINLAFDDKTEHITLDMHPARSSEGETTFGTFDLHLVDCSLVKQVN